MTNRTKSKSIVSVGVDVGKQFLDICIQEQEGSLLKNSNRIQECLTHYI